MKKGEPTPAGKWVQNRLKTGPKIRSQNGADSGLGPKLEKGGGGRQKGPNLPQKGGKSGKKGANPCITHGFPKTSGPETQDSGISEFWANFPEFPDLGGGGPPPYIYTLYIYKGLMIFLQSWKTAGPNARMNFYTFFRVFFTLPTCILLFFR